MVQRRSLATCIILSLVTCGIYGIYWYICLADDVNTVTGRGGMSGGVVFLLTLVTCGIYGIIWAYQAGEALDALRVSHGRATGSQGILYLVLNLFGLGIVTYALMQNELNDYAA